jgi:hypothetical protein
MKLHRCAPVLLLLSGLLGCAGAKDQDVLGSSSGTTSSSGGTTSSSGGTTSSSGGTTSSSGGTTSSSGGTLDAGTPCVQEAEPNDSEDQANLLAPSRCGTISTANDVDFLTFTLKPTTQTLSLRYDGKVTLKVSVSGANTVVLGGGGSQTVPFVRGQPYFVEIQALDKSRPPWRVDLIETP